MIKVTMSKLQLDNAIEMYKNGKSCNFIGKELGFKDHIVSARLKENGVVIERLRRNKIYSVNENFFELIDTEEKAYWLGFLYADGYNSQKSICLRLQLQNIDIEHIKKFQKSIDSNHKIYRVFGSGNKNCHNNIYPLLCINNRKISENLANLGCIQNKSLKLKFPTNDQVPDALIHHFIRGYFDGDGCINIRMSRKKEHKKSARIHIAGTYEFLLGIKNILSAMCIYSSIRKTISENKIKYLACDGSLKVEKFYKYMYKDATVYLDRKFNIFSKWLNERNTIV